MNTILLIPKSETLKAIQKDNIEIKELEGSMLVIAEKRIIVPENKIIVEKYEAPSLIQYQTEDKDKYERTPSGILLSR